MDERRTRARAPFRGWVEITVDGQRRVAAGRDVSARGLGVALAEPHPAPTFPVRSEFVLPGISLPLALDATVAWSDPSRGLLGLCFRRVDPPIAELLERYLIAED